MNIRLFLTTSSLVLLSWMAAMYAVSLPTDDSYSGVQLLLQENAESVVLVTDEHLELTAQ